MQAGKFIQAATLVLLSSLLGACCNTGCIKDQTAAVVEKEKNLAVMKSSTYYFGFDKSELLPIAKTELDEVAKHLVENTDRKIHIDGNTNARGPAKYNVALGMRRAEAVANYLVSKGVSEDRISIESHGAQNLVNNGTTNEAHAANRRANVAFEAVDTATA